MTVGKLFGLIAFLVIGVIVLSIIFEKKWYVTFFGPLPIFTLTGGKEFSRDT